MNKVAIITGSSRGIGKSIARELALQGIFVIINYRTDEDRALQVLEEIRRMGGNGSICQADVSKYEEAARLVKYTVDLCGQLDILVNNAGVSHHGLLMDTTEGQYDRLMDTNLKGTFNVTRHALPHLLARRGSILNISSIWSQHGAANEVVYSMTKAGINAFTKSLAKEMAPMGIRVNCIAPGIIDTEMNHNLTQEEKDNMVCYLASNRLGTVLDVAKTAQFLLSEEAAYINGQIITIDGGLL
ncbi:SDR family oxidoreductase [Clostridiaceae bacterium HFYG-1003]|nr:SDR family oxidoreductase [Clostridiaceae bacterium HFYG-1003]